MGWFIDGIARTRAFILKIFILQLALTRDWKIDVTFKKRAPVQLGRLQVNFQKSSEKHNFPDL